MKNYLNKLRFNSFKEVDLNYLAYFDGIDNNFLNNHEYVEKLLLKLGINDEVLSEIPDELMPFCGYGLKYWQYPNQFSKYLVALRNYNIKSYLEIGVRFGGTFIITVEFLNKISHLKEAIGIDIYQCKSLQKYSKINKKAKFYKVNSISNKFKKIINNKVFDLVLIDGNHEEDVCRSDFYNVKNCSNIISIHDIISVACPGVQKVWNEIKINHEKEFSFYEFTDQYEEYFFRNKKKYFGIGMAVRKNWMAQ